MPSGPTTVAPVGTIARAGLPPLLVSLPLGMLPPAGAGWAVPDCSCWATAVQISSVVAPGERSRLAVLDAGTGVTPATPAGTHTLAVATLAARACSSALAAYAEREAHASPGRGAPKPKPPAHTPSAPKD